MDLSRRMARGRLSEIFGERTRELDISRLDLLVPAALDEAENNLPPDLKKLLDHYCRGVNLFIETQNLPPEFHLLGYRPQPWQIIDCLAIFKNMEALLADSGGELNNLKLVQALGEKLTRQLTGGNAGISIIGPEEWPSALRHPTLATEMARESEIAATAIGSNNWVVSGSRTLSGAPFLANDPHLPSQFPSYFYQIIARCGDLELSGNTLPGEPLVIIGRNRDLGWGFTNIGTDVIDYFILTRHPRNANLYRWEGRWQELRRIRQVLLVKGRGETSHETRYSVLGPVFEEGNLLLARHSIDQYPATVMEAIFGMNLARNSAEFLAALKKFSSPAQNVVFADRQGNIGYFPTGRVPRRGRGDGSLPQPAESAKDGWQGFFSEEEKPYLFNPAKGYVVTANNAVLPEGKLPLSRASGPPPSGPNVSTNCFARPAA